jgi:hypothetical protein
MEVVDLVMFSTSVLSCKELNKHNKQNGFLSLTAWSFPRKNKNRENDEGMAVRRFFRAENGNCWFIVLLTNLYIY